MESEEDKDGEGAYFEEDSQHASLNAKFTTRMDEGREFKRAEIKRKQKIMRELRVIELIVQILHYPF